MKILYLHIGTPRTGTSSIQKFLLKNKEVLAKKGVSFELQKTRYKKIDICRNAHFLYGNFYNADGSRNEEKSEEVRRTGYESLAGQFERSQSVIISDEGLWGNLANSTEALDTLKVWCDEREIILKIIVYIRRQDKFAESFWKQLTREGNAAPAFSEYLDDEKLAKRTNYLENLMRAARIAGKENVIVRRFGKEYFAGGTPQADFLDAVGLSIGDEYSFEDEVLNVSLNNDYVMILRILNGISREPEIKFNKDSKLFSKVAVRLSEREDEYCTLLTDDETRAYLKRFDADNEKIARDFLGTDGELFKYTPSAFPVWSEESEHFRDSVVKFFGQLLLDMNKRCEKIEEALGEKNAAGAAESKARSAEKKSQKVPAKTGLARRIVRKLKRMI